MALILSTDSISWWVSLSIFQPLPPFSNAHLISLLSSTSLSFHRTGFVKSAILTSLSNSSSAWVAVYSVWEKGIAPDVPCPKHPKLDAYEKAVSSIAKTVDASWYEISCWDCKDPFVFPQLLLGDIVHLRGIRGSPEYQDLLPYSCLAVLKAYFHKAEGLRSCTFYKSLDGMKMTGLGVWETVEAAYAILGSADGAPGEIYWRSLGAMPRFGIYQVVFITTD